MTLRGRRGRAMCYFPVVPLLRNRRSPLKITRRVVPMSAATAIQRVAYPDTAAARKPALIASETTTFCRTIDTMRRPNMTASGIFLRSSAISATSAVSIAAGAPAAPIAMPTEARASAGASLIPSPTMATAPWEATSSSTFRSLSSGRRPESTSPIPTSFPLPPATSSPPPDPSPLPRRPGDVVAVPGEHDDVLHPEGRKRPYDLPRLGPDLVLQFDGSGDSLVRPHEDHDAGCPLFCGGKQRSPCGGRRADLLEQPVVPDEHPSPLHFRRDPPSLEHRKRPRHCPPGRLRDPSPARLVS